MLIVIAGLAAFVIVLLLIGNHSNLDERLDEWCTRD